MARHNIAFLLFLYEREVFNCRNDREISYSNTADNKSRNIRGTKMFVSRFVQLLSITDKN